MKEQGKQLMDQGPEGIEKGNFQRSQVEWVDLNKKDFLFSENKENKFELIYFEFFLYARHFTGTGH